MKFTFQILLKAWMCNFVVLVGRVVVIDPASECLKD